MQEMQETQVQALGQKDPLEEGMATHSSILTGESPWTEEPGGLQSIGLQSVNHDWSDIAHIHVFTIWFFTENVYQSLTWSVFVCVIYYLFEH